MSERKRRDNADEPRGLTGYQAQPKFESLVMRGPRRFTLTTRLPSGDRIDVPLGHLSPDARRDPPRP